MSDFLDAYARLYNVNVGKAPLIPKGAARLVEPVLQQCGPNLAHRMLRWFFKSDDPFYLQTGYALKAFVGCAPQLLAQVNVLGLDTLDDMLGTGDR